MTPLYAKMTFLGFISLTVAAPGCGTTSAQSQQTQHQQGSDGSALGGGSGQGGAGAGSRLLPVDLGPAEGVVFAEEAGGSVEMRVLATGESVQVPDGARVTIVSGPGTAEPMSGRAELTIRYKGAEGSVPNPSVATAERADIRADGGATVFAAVRECEERCVSDIWLWKAGGQRLKVADDAGPQHAVSFSPDGRWVAIGSRELQVVNLLQMRATPYFEFTAPAYAPDGGLLVRGVGDSDAVYEIGEFGQGVEVAREDGAPPAGVMAPPVTFEDGGRTVIAVFRRGGKDKTVRVSR